MTGRTGESESTSGTLVPGAHVYRLRSRFLTLVPSDFGRLLGMDLTRNVALVSGVAGSPLRVSVQEAEVGISGQVLRAKIAVAARNDVPYLLGRQGVFRFFRIVFEEYKARVRFESAR